jgi:outer membrane protease
MKMTVARAAIAVAVAFASPVASAANGIVVANDVTFSGGVGVIGIEGREYVYASTGSSDIMSLLIWQSVAPVLTTGFDITLSDGWTIDGKAQVAISGDSFMVDYDWISTAPGFTNYAFDNWTHRSQHDATNLDWFFNGSLALGRGIVATENVTVNVNGGFKYTDVQWTAFGGSFVYSGTGFRADVFSTPDSQRGITYRQQFPTAFLGLDTEIVRDQWTFGFGAQGGVAFHAKGTDNHWQRNPGPLGLLFIDTLQMAPTVSVSASAEYTVTDQVNLFLAGTVDKIFLARGDSKIYDNNTGALLVSSPDSGGAELLSGTLTVGFKGKF